MRAVGSRSKEGRRGERKRGKRVLNFPANSHNPSHPKLATTRKLMVGSRREALGKVEKGENKGMLLVVVVMARVKEDLDYEEVATEDEE